MLVFREIKRDSVFKGLNFTSHFSAHSAIFSSINVEYICRIPKGYRMEQLFTQLAVKIMFNDFTGFEEIMWTIILP